MTVVSSECKIFAIMESNLGKRNVYYFNHCHTNYD
jgi:hypothetical protein